MEGLLPTPTSPKLSSVSFSLNQAKIKRQSPSKLRRNSKRLLEYNTRKAAELLHATFQEKINHLVSIKTHSVLNKVKNLTGVINELRVKLREQHSKFIRQRNGYLQKIEDLKQKIAVQSSSVYGYKRSHKALSYLMRVKSSELCDLLQVREIYLKEYVYNCLRDEVKIPKPVFKSAFKDPWGFP